MEQIIGLLAATFTTFSLLPQALKIHKTKETKDISVGMCIVLTIGVSLWLTYGVMIQNTPIIIANGISLPFALYIFIMTAKNRKK